MPFDAVFDARSVAPRQGGGAHPVGNKFPFNITNTAVKAVKPEREGDQPKGGLFEVEFTSPVGSVIHRYNLWNESETARRIANENLSALCHATGIFTIDFKNDGAALRGAKGLMDIGFQKGHEPSAEKPEGGYVELKKVYDINGNEPGKAQQQPNNAQQQGNFQQQPQTQQGGPQVQSGFGQTNPQSQQNNAQAGQAGGWGAAQQQPAQNQQQPNQGGGWSQQQQQDKPPWG